MPPHEVNFECLVRKRKNEKIALKIDEADGKHDTPCGGMSTSLPLY